MALEGSIQEFGLTEIFQLILIQKKEGTLALTHEKDSVFVYFKGGQIVKIQNGAEEEALGNALIRTGKITIEQLKKGLNEQKIKKQPLIQILTGLKYISAAEIKKANRLFTEETIFQLFSWKTGKYKFEQKEVVYDPDLIDPLSTEFILMEGMRRIDEWPLLLKKIPSREAVFEWIDGHGPMAENVADTEEKSPQGQEASFESMGDLGTEGGEDAWLNRLLDGERTVQQIIDHSEMGAFPVYKAMAELLSQGKIKLRDTKGRAGQTNLSFQTLTRGQSILKALVSAAVAAAFAGLFVHSYPAIQKTWAGAVHSTREVQNLLIYNEQDILRFALDLYYLKHRHYPETLQRLVEEGFLKTRRERQIDLARWHYQGEALQFKLHPK